MFLVQIQNKGFMKNWAVKDERIEYGMGKEIQLEDITKVDKKTDSDGNICLTIWVRNMAGQSIIETVLTAQASDEENVDMAISYIEQHIIQHNSDYGLASQFLDSSTFSFASGRDLPYVVLQVTLKEKLIGTGSENLTELEDVINAQASRGYRLHTFSTASANSTGLAGGDRIQATMVFEKIV